MSNSSSVPTVFLQFFTWIALRDVDLPFSLILVTKANAVEGGTSSTKWYDSYTWLMARKGRRFLLFSNTAHACWILLNRKLSCIAYAKSCYTENYHINLKSYVNFQVELKQNCIKWDMPVFIAQLKIPPWLLPVGIRKTMYHFRDILSWRDSNTAHVKVLPFELVCSRILCTDKNIQ